MEYKRLIKIENLTGDTVAVLRIKGNIDYCEYNFSFVESQFKNADYIAVLNGVYTELCSFSGKIYADLQGDICIAAFLDGKAVGCGNTSGKKITAEDLRRFEAYSKTKQKKDEFKEDFIYDDFKIAEENYYKKECLDEINSDVDTQKQYFQAGKNQGIKDALSNDETNSVVSEKSGYKPENGNYYTQKQCETADEYSVESDKVLQRAISFDEYYQFRKITANKKRFYGFDKVIQKCEFYKMGDKKFYYFGAVYEDDSVKYFVYAVPSKRGNPPKGFENGFFIPESFFNLQTGFYCLFQKSSFKFD